MRSLIRGSLGALLLLAALMAAMKFVVMSEGDGTGRVLAGPGPTLSLDMEISDGACVDMDGSVSLPPLSSFQFAVCLSNPGTVPVASFSYYIIYDDAIVNIPEVADVTPSLDDNPDANAGATTFAPAEFGANCGNNTDDDGDTLVNDGCPTVGTREYPVNVYGDPSPCLNNVDDDTDGAINDGCPSQRSLGFNWSCDGGVGAHPKGDVEPTTGAGNGKAFSGGCGSASGPNYLLGGPLGVISGSMLQTTTATFEIVQAIVTNDDLMQVGSCNPTDEVPMTCSGGTLSVGLPPPPTFTPTPDPSCATPSASDDELRPNGTQVPGDNDATWPYHDNFNDQCDGDDDNDGRPDQQEPLGIACNNVSDSQDFDSDNDHLHDGWECANGSNPTDSASKFLGMGADDADGDRVPDLWEQRGYNSRPDTSDSDFDSCGDLVEIASVDGNRTIGDGDRLSVARRALNIWGPDTEQDWVLDIDANGVVGDSDRLFVARAALLPDWLPKSCP